MFPIDQAVIFGKRTGKVMGTADSSICLENYYIIRLDVPEKDGPKAILVHGDSMKLLTCHWCQDSQQVPVTPFTMPQYESNTIPTKPCPYCTEKEVVCG